MLYLDVQGEVLRLTKSFVKAFSKKYAPETVIYYRKRKLNGQQSLFPAEAEDGLEWKLETVKLVELIAALSEAKAFGEHVTRKDLWSYFSSSFSVSLDHAEKSLSQMKYRKMDQSKFIDGLRKRFIKLMDKGLD